MANFLCFYVSVCLCFSVVLCQYGFNGNEYRRYQNNGNYRRLTGVVHIDHERNSPPERRNDYIFPPQQRPEYNPYQNYNSYENPIINRYDDYGRPINNPQGQQYYQNYPIRNNFQEPAVNFNNDNQNYSPNREESINQVQPNVNSFTMQVYRDIMTNSPAVNGFIFANQNPSNGRETPVIFENRNSEILPTSAPSFQELTPVPPKALTDLQELTPVPELAPAPPISFGNLPELTSVRNDVTTGLPVLTPVPKSGEDVSFANFHDSCTSVDGGSGTCTAINNCPEYVLLLKTAKSNPAAVQTLRKAHCGFQGKNPKVCCPSQRFPTSPPAIITTTTPTPSPDEGNSVRLPSPPECGFSLGKAGKVVGGVPAKLGDFPWMALLGYQPRRTGGTRWLCGGSLISAKHVLTAAHCMHGHEKDLYLVRLGELDLAREDEGATPIDVLIKQQIPHPEYSATAFTNDIGLLLLERRVDFSSLIRPICIPTDPALRSMTYENYQPIIAGWGDTEFRGLSATHLQALQLPVVSNEFCTQAYKQYKAQTIDERVLCAGYKQGGKDACQGDSGGPLMQPVWNNVTYEIFYQQIGVVSFGRKCAEPGFPGVYTRVTHFATWIEKVVLDTGAS